MITRRAVIWGGGAAALLQAPAAKALACSLTPRYGGRLVTEWLRDGRYMRLVEPYSYFDRCGKQWPVPAGAIVDGASIPRALWTLIGAPFEGSYRDASVIHDWFCAVRIQTPQATHRMFYDAMLTSQVAEQTAKLMYLAVRMFGPSWDELTMRNSIIRSNQGAQRVTGLSQDGLKAREPDPIYAGQTRGQAGALTDAGMMQEEFTKARRRVESGNFDVDQIDALVATSAS